MTNHNLYRLFAQRFVSDQPFILSPQGETLFYYRDIEQVSAGLANFFTANGLAKGDRVLVQVDKSPQALFVYFACLRAGLIYLPLNSAYTRRELTYFITNAEPGLVICDPAQQSLFSEIASCPVLTLNKEGQGSAIDEVNHRVASGEQQNFETVHCEFNDVVSIIYTSGTTGQPKGAMISHGNLASNGLALADAWGWCDDDVMLHALPIFHIHGLFIATHLPVLHSSPIVFLPKFDSEQVIRLLPKATVFMGVPTHYVRLLDHKEFTKDHCNNIRVFTSGSAPMLVQTHKQIKQRTGRDVVERYGMTEAGIITTNPIHSDVKIGTVGLPMKGVSLRIVNEQGHETNINDTGAIQVKGDSIFQGYWRMPEKNASEFTEDGYFITGDLGSKDECGYVTISGRGKDLIISGGLNVYPKEIELVIDQIPGVLESAVIGLPHRDFGEAVTAIVVANGINIISDVEIIQDLKSKLANFKVPKTIHFVDELPRNTMGKVQKNILREKFKAN